MNIHASTPTLTPAETALIEAFADRLSQLPGDAAVIRRRDDAIETLKAGLPTRRVEAWHYTDLRRLIAAVPGFAPGDGPARLAPLLAGSQVQTVSNGRAGTPPRLPGLTARPLAEALQQGMFSDRLVAAGADDAIGALNAAFVSDGVALAIADGAVLEAPLELQCLQAGGQAHVRFPVTVGAGARATIIERQAGTGAGLVTSQATVEIGESAELVWVILQEQPDSAVHLGQFVATLAADAKLTLVVLNTGGRLVRQEVRVAASGEGAEFRLRGVNLLAGSAHCDVTMVLDHSAAHTVSSEIVRNVVTDRAHGVFQGQIRVAREAQKTDARMACNTLLLSDDAEFSTKPELEIFADDVACGHGATVTEINRDHLFYLMARGIDEKAARKLLVKAFVAEVVEELEDAALVAALEERLDGWFAEHG